MDVLQHCSVRPFDVDRKADRPRVISHHEYPSGTLLRQPANSEAAATTAPASGVVSPNITEIAATPAGSAWTTLKAASKAPSRTPHPPSEIGRAEASSAGGTRTRQSGARRSAPMADPRI